MSIVLDVKESETMLLSVPTKGCCVEHEVVSQEEVHSSPSKEDTLDSEEEVFHCEGDLLMVRRLLKSQLIDLEQSQRENYSKKKGVIFFEILILWSWITCL